MSDYYTEEAEYFRQKIEFEKAFEDTYGVTFDRIRELAEAERDGRVVVLPVAVGEIAETSAGKAIVKNWEIVARVTFCEPLNDGRFWGDKYADFDISDIGKSTPTNAESWHETRAEAARALAEKGEATT